MKKGYLFYFFAGWTVLFLIMVSGVGCSGYQAGSLMHPQIDTVFIAPVKNQTDEPELGQHVRTFVSSRLMRDGSVEITSKKEADTVLALRVKDYDTSEAASARIRDDNLVDEERDEYQTTVYRAGVDVELRLTAPGRQKPVLDWRSVRGKAMFTRLPDMADSQRDGLRQAAENASKKIIYRFTEAW